MATYAFGNIGFIRQELRQMMPKYTQIEDCLAGDMAIKQRDGLAIYNSAISNYGSNIRNCSRAVYLPMPNSYDLSNENLERYQTYLQGAVFYNVTARTHSSLTGLVKTYNADAKLPDKLKNLKGDTNGSGITLRQLAKRCVQYNLAQGRGGVLTDFPTTGGTITKDKILNGDVSPTMIFYKPKDIINWRHEYINGRDVLVLVVIAERFWQSDDGFEITEGNQWKVLRLEPLDGKLVYSIETFKKNENNTDWIRIPVSSDYFPSGESFKIFPTDKDGSHFDYIPFEFEGSENNDSNVDHPPIYDLTVLNIAHYRNSAAYEESCLLMGQPTLWASGMTQEWVDDVLKGKILLGVRGGLMMPPGAQAGLLQANPNTLAFEAMKLKEEQMRAIGAKLVELSVGNRTTATEAMIDDSSESSVLINAAGNASDCLTRSLHSACRFVGADPKEAKVDLDTDLEITRMTPLEQQQVVANWQADAITEGEMRRMFKRAGLTQDNEEEAIKQLQESRDKKRADEIARIDEVNKINQKVLPETKPTIKPIK